MVNLVLRDFVEKFIVCKFLLLIIGFIIFFVGIGCWIWLKEFWRDDLWVELLYVFVLDFDL